MPDRRHSSGLGPWAILAAMVLAVGGGCYQPTIVDGGFKCAPPPEKRCPDGYSCDTASATCRKAGKDGGLVDLAVAETMPEAARDSTPERMCVQPKPGCTPAAGGGVCDPVCQTGCGCSEHCSVNGVGDLACVTPLPGASVGLGRACVISAAGTPTQVDNCAPGLICLDEACGGRCFQHCRNNEDCTNATCSRRLEGGRMVCEVPFVACNPVGMNSGCASTAHACYVSGSVADKTFCDCPANAVGENGACSSQQDCLRGLVCVDPTNSMEFRCRRVCNLSGNNNCPNGSCRRHIADSNVFGFCN